MFVKAVCARQTWQTAQAYESVRSLKRADCNNPDRVKMARCARTSIHINLGTRGRYEGMCPTYRFTPPVLLAPLMIAKLLITAISWVPFEL